MHGRCGGIVRGSDVGQEIVSVDALGGVVRLGRWVGTDRPHVQRTRPALRNSTSPLRGSGFEQCSRFFGWRPGG